MIRTRPSYRDISLYSPPSVPCRVDLSDNTNLFGMPPAAERALRETVSSTVTRYPISYAPDLKKALSAYTGFEPSWLTTGCGSDDLIDCSLRALLEPGEPLGVPEPSFSMMSYFAKVNGLQYTPVPLRRDFDIDVDGLLATGARLIYVCSPNNPTGTVVSRAALERLVDAAPGLVLLDEAYVEFASGSHVDLVRSRPNVLEAVYVADGTDGVAPLLQRAGDAGERVHTLGPRVLATQPPRAVRAQDDARHRRKEARRVQAGAHELHAGCA